MHVYSTQINTERCQASQHSVMVVLAPTNLVITTWARFPAQNPIYFGRLPLGRSPSADVIGSELAAKTGKRSYAVEHRSIGADE